MSKNETSLIDSISFSRTNEESVEIPSWWKSATGLLTGFKSKAEQLTDSHAIPESHMAMFRENVEFVERYEINDYADAVILYNNTYKNYVYYVDEPDLGKYEAVLEEAKRTLDQELPYKEEVPETEKEKIELHQNRAEQFLKNKDKTTQIQNRMFELLSRISPSFNNYKKRITDEIIDKILYYIRRDLVLLGDVQPLMEDDYIEDINIDRPELPIYVFHQKYGQGGNIVTNVYFPSEDMNAFIQKLAQKAGITVSSANPIGDGSLPDGSRLNLTYSDEVTDGGSNATIRLFEDDPLTPPDLIEFGTFNVNQMAYIWLAVENEMSIMFVGGTAAGKTTSLNCASMFIPKKFKIVSIEDTREVALPHENWIKQVTREQEGEAEEIGFKKLLVSALRQRPDYIMMGEVRDEEAQKLFEGMSTGHASVSTFHANDTKAAVSRLSDDLGVSRQKMRELDIISVQKRYTQNGDDLRRVTEMGEIKGIDENDKVEIVSTYDYDIESDTYNKYYNTSESVVLDEIRERNIWSDEQLQQEIKDRERVLQQMVDEDIKDYEEVTFVVQTYMKSKEKIMGAVESGNLESYINSVTND
jgi:flagellar protein FlaI